MDLWKSATNHAGMTDHPMLDDVAHLLERLATDLDDADVAIGLRLALIRSPLGDREELPCETSIDAC